MLNWLDTVNALMDRIEWEFTKLAECSAEDATMQAFPMHPTACTSYAGCQYHDLCTCLANPLSLNAPPMGFTYYWWNPLAEVKKEISNE